MGKLLNIVGYKHAYKIDDITGVVTKNGKELISNYNKQDNLCYTIYTNKNTYKQIERTVLLASGRSGLCLTKSDIFIRDYNEDNLLPSNIIYGDGLRLFYYRYCHDNESLFNLYMKDRCSVINETVKNALDKGLIPVVKVKDFMDIYIVDSNGIVINIETGKVISHRKTVYGYLQVSLALEIGNFETINVGRVVLSSFKRMGNIKTTVMFKDRVRTNHKLNNLTWSTREEISKIYMCEVPNHVEKYLGPSIIKHMRKVKIDGILYDSIRDASRFIVSDYNKQHSSKVTLNNTGVNISNRLNGKVKNTLMYGKYKVSKVIEKEVK